jgi:hypothetical protein
VQLEVNSE